MKCIFAITALLPIMLTSMLWGNDDRPTADNDTLLRFYPDDPDTLNLINASDNVSTAFQRLV